MLLPLDVNMFFNTYGDHIIIINWLIDIDMHIYEIILNFKDS